MCSIATGAASGRRWCGHEVGCVARPARRRSRRWRASRCRGDRRRPRGAAAFLAGRQSADGGFAEQGRAADAPLTAWAALGLVAGDGSAAARARALGSFAARGRRSTRRRSRAARRRARGARGNGARERPRAAPRATGPTSSSTPRSGPSSRLRPRASGRRRRSFRRSSPRRPRAGDFRGRGWQSRLERHGGGDPGAPGRRRRRRPVAAPSTRCGRSRIGTAGLR